MSFSDVPVEHWAYGYIKWAYCAGIISGYSDGTFRPEDPTTRGQVALIMLEPRPWDGSELRLFQLQEKINAYLSFALDGEMAAEYPALANLPLRLQLDCAEPPDSMVQHFLGIVREQIAFQGIDLTVRVFGAQGCGPSCACAAES
jgi:hypothetical protein